MTKLDTRTDTDTDSDTSADTDILAEPAAAAVPARRLRVPTFGLSATQLIATGLAATTATFAASYLGVKGTVIGAALASVMTAVGNAVYGQSLRSTRDRVRVVVPSPRRAPGSAAGAATRPLPVAASTPDEDVPELPASRPSPRPRPARTGGLSWRRVTLIAVGVFVSVLALVTTVELIAGRPVSDLLRGSSGAGTSFFGDQQVTTRTVPPTAPTVYVTVTPKVVVTTPTVTQTAPARTATTTPSASDTPTTSAPSSGATSSDPSTSGSSSSASARP